MSVVAMGEAVEREDFAVMGEEGSEVGTAWERRSAQLAMASPTFVALGISKLGFLDV